MSDTPSDDITILPESERVRLTDLSTEEQLFFFGNVEHFLLTTVDQTVVATTKGNRQALIDVLKDVKIEGLEELNPDDFMVKLGPKTWPRTPVTPE